MTETVSKLEPRRRSRLARLWRRGRWAAMAVGIAAVATIIAWYAAPFDLDRLDAYPRSDRVIDREGRTLRVWTSETGEIRIPVALGSLSPWIVRATIAVEDQRFRSHPGVDVLAVARAFVQNIRRGEIHSGASTLTMQVVRMLENRPRTFTSKLIEAFHAIQLDRWRSKDEILEAYLNLAPYGGNLRGVEAASRRYFGKSASELSLSEAALIAGLPQSPSRYAPDRHLERALARRETVLAALQREGWIGEAEHAAALADIPVVRRHAWPFIAPHLADEARRLARRQNVAEGVTAGDVEVALDPSAQSIAERLLRGAFEGGARGRGLTGSLVALHVASGEIRALVGSPDWRDSVRDGQVNGAFARRSSGSTLKPFLYALAWNRGLAGPGALVDDTPLVLAREQAENFDRGYRGLVPAAESLAESLNLPAVRLQAALGGERFLSLLRDLGLRSLDRASSDYGASLSLGGGEIRLVDLVSAYAALVRGGREAPWRLDRGGAVSSRPVFSSGAAWLTLEALSDRARVERALRGPLEEGEGPIGYKTGTSFGQRDALAVAFAPDWVVGVWMGHPSGRADPELVGVDAALPIALGVLRLLSASRANSWPRPIDIVEREVCALTGRPLGASCPSPALGLFPAGAPPLDPCRVHREVLVDPVLRVECCASCRTADARPSIVESWPVAIERWIRDARAAAPKRFPHRSECRSVTGGEAGPRIVEPAHGTEFFLIPGVFVDDRIRLTAAAAPDAPRVHWFVDGTLIARSEAARAVEWTLVPGRHDILCVDERGRSAHSRISVRTGGSIAFPLAGERNPRRMSTSRAEDTRDQEKAEAGAGAGAGAGVHHGGTEARRYESKNVRE
jgi:penicillin-binding protein 1C